ncbi:MAG: MBL fold metallo-hydrolase [Candidatus Rokubacteria bacterium]|nr:MBL fold metallo-hydrolase [Candidatus Rokubacteria bacterium]
MATIECLGGAGTVTGSKFLVEADGRRLLVDCGLFQGLKELRQRNWTRLPLEPGRIDWVALTHGHIDHTGYLPRLVKDGFDGRVYATGATAGLVRILLPDSGHLQEEEAAYHNKRGTSKHQPALPLYTAEEGLSAANRVTGVAWGEPLTLAGGIRIAFRSAGHILGSASVAVDLGEGPTRRRVLFSGDVGRFGAPILTDPAPIGEADYVVVESTYGDRRHVAEPIPVQLERAVAAAVRRGGAVVVPAFAVGRAQELLYHLSELERAGRIARLPTYVDSPMAVDATALYAAHPEEFDAEMRRRVAAGDSPFRYPDLRFARSAEESRAINEVRGPVLIIAGSGMASGGRVLHHLRLRLPDPRTTVLLVGYQAPATRGRLLQEGARSVRIFGDEVPVRARVEAIHGLSAHADRDGLMRWLRTASRPPRRVVVVHGEPAPAGALAAEIRRELGWDAGVPRYRDRVPIE